MTGVPEQHLDSIRIVIADSTPRLLHFCTVADNSSSSSDKVLVSLDDRSAARVAQDSNA